MNEMSEKIDAKMKKVVEGNPMALATVNPDGTPNVIAVAYARVVEGNKIVVTDNYMRRTKENVERNPSCCLAVWDRKWNGYKISGKAQYFSSGKWKKFVEAMPDNSGLPAKGAIVVEVVEASKLA